MQILQSFSVLFLLLSLLLLFLLPSCFPHSLKSLFLSLLLNIFLPQFEGFIKGRPTITHITDLQGLEIFLTSISAHKVHTWISTERWCWLGRPWWHRHRTSWLAMLMSAGRFYSFYLELKSSFSNLGVGAERGRPSVFERVECVGLTALVLSVSHMPPLSAGFPLPSPSSSPATHQAGQTEQQQQPTNLGVINI